MKIKDNDWYDEKIESIKERKKIANKIEDVKIRKKMKNDLKREQRAAKRSVCNNLKIIIKKEIEENEKLP